MPCLSVIKPALDALMWPEKVFNLKKNVKDEIIGSIENLEKDEESRVINLKEVTATDVAVIVLTSVLSGGLVLLIGLPIWLALERAEVKSPENKQFVVNSAQEKAGEIYKKASDALLTKLVEEREKSGEIPHNQDITITVPISENSNATITAKQTYTEGTTTVSITYQGVTVEDESSLEDLTKALEIPHPDYRNFVPTKLIESVEKDLAQKQITEEEPLTQGNLSDTKKLKDSDGQALYYKPLVPKSIGRVGMVACISSTDTRVAQRSIFTYVMSEVLGFHVVPKTAPFSLGNTPGYVQYEAPGTSAQAYFTALKENNQLDSLKSNGPLLKGITGMQLLDSLAGQGDRHSNNYFIDESTNQVTCIDNDISWGEGVTHPHQMIPSFRTDGYLRNNLTEQEKKVVSHLEQEKYLNPISHFTREFKPWTASGRAVFLPPVMDTAMVAKFKHLNEVALKKWMSDFGFTDSEKEAACSRLKAIHSHIHVLEQQQEQGVHSIISPDQWDSEETRERLFPQEGNAGNALQTFTSYLHRDMARMKGLIEYKIPIIAPNTTKELLAEGRFLTQHNLHQLAEDYPDFKEALRSGNVRTFLDNDPALLDEAKRDPDFAQTFLSGYILTLLVKYPNVRHSLLEQGVGNWKKRFNLNVQEFLYNHPRLLTRAEKEPDFAKVCLNLKVLHLFAEHPALFNMAWDNSNFRLKLLKHSVRNFLRQSPESVRIAVGNPSLFDQQVRSWRNSRVIQ